MDSSKISQFFGLAPRLGNASGNAGTERGGFAELMFGIMNKRASTVQQPVAPSRANPYLASDRAVGTLAGTAVATPGAGAPASCGVMRCAPGADSRADLRTGAVPASGERSPAHGTVTVDDTERGTRASAETAEPDEEVTPAGAGSDVASEGEATEADDTTPPEGEEGQAEDGDPFAADSGADMGDSGEWAAAQLPTPQPSQPGTPAPAPAPAAAAAAIPAEAAAPVAAADDDAGLAGRLPVDLAGDIAGEPLPDTEVAAEDGDAAGSQQAEDAAPGEIAAAPRSAGRMASAEGGTPTVLPVDSWDDAAAQAGLLSRRGQRPSEDQAAMFRQMQQGAQHEARQRSAAAGQGAASQGAAGNAAQIGASGSPAGAANVPAGSPLAAGQAPSTVLPPGLSFDTAFGQSSGLPGWQLHLAQGAASRRTDFVANLRQHLQNLPAHEQVALGIQRAAREGGGRISLQLSPAELGRIHVKLEIDRENNARASVTVERPATLDLLQRDSRALERALQEAGLKMDRNDLNFSLHGGERDSFAQEFGSDGGQQAARGNGALGEGEDEPTPLAGRTDVLATGDGMVDVQI
ncbi:flagellar hook-length control protein FliK [Dongia mobilis]|nr:flagellar hook-length control protein FliK [Dongia mobilis]